MNFQDNRKQIALGVGTALIIVLLVIVVWRKNRTAGITLMVLAILIGLPALGIWSLMQNISVSVDQQNVVINNPLTNGDLSSGQLTGILPIVISNPTPYGFLTIDSVSATITDPSGNVLAEIDAPANIDIPRNGSTTIPLAFTAQVETALASAIGQFFTTKSESAIVSGRAYFLGGIAWYSFSSTFNIKV